MWFFLRHLRLRQHAIWEQLGEPSLLLNNNIKNNLAVLRFLLKQEYRNTKDKSLIRLASFVRIYLLFYFFYFLAFLILGIMGI
jgi:hypothetical protein